MWKWIVAVAFLLTPTVLAAQDLADPNDHPAIVAETTASLGAELGAFEWLFTAPADEIWDSMGNCVHWDRPRGWGEGWFGWLDRLFALNPECGWRP